MLYVKRGVNFRVIQKDNGPVSYVHMEILGERGNFFHTYVYMPRSSDYHLLFEILASLFVKVDGKRHVIMGDFNLNLLSDENAIREYMYLCTSYCSGTIIDHVISNFYPSCNYTIANDLSDHSGLFSFFDLELSSASTPEYRYVRKCDYQRLNYELAQLLDDVSVLDVNDSFDYLVNSIKTCMNECTIMQQVRVRPNWIKRPWINRFLRRLMNRKKVLLRRSRKHPFDVSVRISVRNIGKEIDELEANLRTQYFAQRFRHLSSRNKVWVELNRLFGRTKASRIIDRVMSKSGNNFVQGKREIANELNDYFVSVGQSASDENQSAGSRSQARRSVMNSMFLRCVTEHEVYLQINGLDPRKSSGVDGISNRVLKSIATTITPYLTRCINRVFETGTYPNALKVARVVPIHKGGSTEQM